MIRSKLTDELESLGWRFTGFANNPGDGYLWCGSRPIKGNQDLQCQMWIRIPHDREHIDEKDLAVLDALDVPSRYTCANRLAQTYKFEGRDPSTHYSTYVEFEFDSWIEVEEWLNNLP